VGTEKKKKRKEVKEGGKGYKKLGNPSYRDHVRGSCGIAWFKGWVYRGAQEWRGRKQRVGRRSPKTGFTKKLPLITAHKEGEGENGLIWIYFLGEKRWPEGGGE